MNLSAMSARMVGMLEASTLPSTVARFIWTANGRVPAPVRRADPTTEAEPSDGGLK